MELYDNDCDMYYEGDIIVKNELTTKLVEYLLLDDEFLQTKCGLEDVHGYRLGLLKMVQLVDLVIMQYMEIIILKFF